ncbi:MAG: type III pantothenate kinase [Bdellovibrionota bacterium]
MVLTLDIGNSQIFGGVFQDKELLLQFRKSHNQILSSDEAGIYFKAVLRENNIDPALIERIVMCSVVPDLMHSVASACMKYFNIRPFVLRTGVKTGLNIKYRNPQEVGADRIANSIAGTQLYPDKNLVIVDLGTATTFCVVNKKREYLGGLILPGLRLMMESLEWGTSKLPKVEITKSFEVVARSTIENIQSGLYLGNLCLLEGLISRIKQEHFANEELYVIGTGGFSKIYEDQGIFHYWVPGLILQGLKFALELNSSHINSASSHERNKYETTSDAF